MFNVTARPTFRREVTINTPDGDGVRKESLTATYRVLPTTEVEKFNLDTGEGTAEFLRAAIIRLDDIADAAGKAVEYSDDVRDQVLAWPHARGALAVTYFDELAKAREGN